ncbi:NAD(P)-dependent oxidoreductase [Segetibacter koreensis]|uniref:NAD(P)-dependent oxidoreductase n=1 Tax=Segetibacter koreensis TaxID=398037 RepID=UPI001B7FA3B0|nr:NAD(P)-dependent oxidoreductase [Segetibacter koreensis]
MSNLKIGWAGLGNMAKNLLKAGFNVTVYNRTKEKELIESGTKSAETPSQLAEQCDVVMTMVSDDEAVKEIYTGKNGLLTNENLGKLAIDMSTVSPETSRYLADACFQKGMDFIDAPVSGSVKPAQDGTLIIMAGGAQQAYERAKQIFDVIGKFSIYVGENGARKFCQARYKLFIGIKPAGTGRNDLVCKRKGYKDRRYGCHHQ